MMTRDELQAAMVRAYYCHRFDPNHTPMERVAARIHAVGDLVLQAAATIVQERREKVVCDEDWDLMQAAYERIRALLSLEPPP